MSFTGRSGRPTREEAASYYFKYIDRITDPDVVRVLDAQLPATLDYLRSFSEQESLHRYDPGKWSAWTLSGIASDNPFTVRALAYVAAGHLDHHVAILRERYRVASP